MKRSGPTQKQKLEGFDALRKHAQKLELAIHSLTTGRLPFVHAVTVDASQIDSTYKNRELRFTVSVAERGDPLYMVQKTGHAPEFWHESELQHNGTIFWRMVNHAIWLMGQRSLDRQRRGEVPA